MLAITTRAENHTYVVVEPEPNTMFYGLGLVGLGEARCRPEDMYVAATGQAIAMGRAIQDLGRQIEAIGLEESVSLNELGRVARAMLLEAAEATAE